MKKNILIVQALLLLPLITSSLLLGMEKTEKTLSKRNRKKKTNNALVVYLPEQTKTQEKTPQATLKEEPAKAALQEKAARNNHHELIQELRKSLSDKKLPTTYHTISTETESDESPTFPFTDSQELVPHTVQQQIIDKSTEEEIVSIPDALLQSVILPTEKKGLDFFDTILYYTSKKPISRIIFLLQSKTFKSDNQSYFEWLNEAIQIAIKNEDFDSLATIATLCQADEYKETIRISDEVAQPAVALCATKYMTELSLAHKAIENNRQDKIADYNTKTLAFTKALSDMINGHKQDLQNIADDYDKSITQEVARINTMQEQISNFTHLNKSIRAETTSLLQVHTIEMPKNKFSKNVEASTQQLNNLATIGTNMPQIKTPQHVLLNSLAIDNK